MRSAWPSTVLIAYATHFGSTREVAEVVSGVMRDSGLRTDVGPVEDVASVLPYGAVVLGSPVHRGELLPSAVDFARRFAPCLREMPVAVFCMRISKPTPRSREAYLKSIQEDLRPVSAASFTGRFDGRGAALFMPRILASLVPPIDRRDWPAIRTWARRMAVLLSSPGSPRQDGPLPGSDAAPLVVAGPAR